MVHAAGLGVVRRLEAVPRRAPAHVPVVDHLAAAGLVNHRLRHVFTVEEPPRASRERFPRGTPLSHPSRCSVRRRSARMVTNVCPIRAAAGG